MSVGNTRRVIGGVSAFAVAAGFAVTAGVGMAGAAPGSVSWADGGSNFVRTVSNVTPVEGEIVTSSMKFMRSSTPVEYIQAVKDFHPACLTYVEGSAKVDGSPHGLESQGADFARVTGSWAVYPNINPKSHTFEFSYKVGANCDRDVAMNTWTDYSGTLGSGSYPNKGTTVTVSKNVSTTALAAVPAGVRVGQSVPLSATVTGGVDGNVVEFFDGTTKLGQGPLAAGKAAFAWTPAAAGGHSLTAKFLGTAKASESVSAAQNVPVTPADVVTTTAVTGPATAVAGADVTLNVQVSPIPSGGTVQFKDGATNLGGPVTLDAQGKGSITQQFATGARSVTAVYSGAGEFQPSTSGAHNVNVTPADVATTTSVTGPATAVEGADVTFDVQVSPVPVGGTVQFKNGGVDLGAAVTLDGEGKGSITQQFATVGAQSITAVFSGAAGFITSTSAVHAVTVTAPTPVDVATMTTVTGASSAVTGDNVTLGVQVSPAPAGGTVQFKDGADNLGGPVTLDGSGKASITQSFAAEGAHSITAVFSGAAGFVASTSAAHTVTVTAPTPVDVATMTTVTGASSAVTGDNVTLGVQVSPAPAGGTVQFKDGADNLGGPVTLDGSGKASITQSFAAEGAHSITAVFSGAAGFVASTSAAHTVTVTAPTPVDVATTTTVTGASSAVTGDNVTLGVQVSPAPAGGTVQFKDGADNLGGPVTLDGSGKASITQSFAAEGAHSITAVFSGAAGFIASTSAVHAVTVTAAAPVDVTTSTVLTLPVDVKTGVAVDLWAAVKAPNGDLIPSGGQVTFKDGGTVIGTVVNVVGGEANVRHTFTSAGTHTVTAEFSGTTGYLASVSQSGTLEVTDPVVTDLATTTVVTLPATATKGVAVNLVATVSPTPAGGTVQFMDGATPIGAPVGLLNGKATRSYAFPITGDRHITAVYSGAPGHLGSTAEVGTVTVAEASTGGGDTGSASGSLGNLFGSS